MYSYDFLHIIFMAMHCIRIYVNRNGETLITLWSLLVKRKIKVILSN